MPPIWCAVRPDGTIRIQWQVPDDHLHLEWDETGGPAIAVPPQTRGFGTMVTERSVADQLGGKIEYDWRRNGLKLRVTVPLARLGV